MPDPLVPEDEGFFDWLGRPRRVSANLLAGEPDRAWRQAADFLLNIPDAVIPGDAIPELSDRESDINVSDALGMEDSVPAWALDAATAALTDPLSFVPLGGAVKGSLNLAKKDIARTPVVGKPILDAAEQGRNMVVDTMNWHTMTPQHRASDIRARAASQNAIDAGLARAEQVAGGLDMPTQGIVVDAFENVRIDPKTKLASRIVQREPVAGFRDIQANTNDVLESLERHPEFRAITDPAIQDDLRQRVRDISKLGQDTFDEGLLSPSMAKGLSNRAYLHREGQLEDMLGGTSAVPVGNTGKTAATSARNIKTDAELEAFLNEKPENMAAYSRDLGSRLANRAQLQGRIVGQQKVATDVIGRRIDPTKTADRQEVLDALDILEKDPQSRDYAVRAKAIFTGDMNINSGVEILDKGIQALQSVNRGFKKAATTGVFVPRVAFGMRNSLSSIWQGLSTEQGRAAIARNPKVVIDRIHGGLTDQINAASKKLGYGSIRSDDVEDAINEIHAALKAGGGTIAGTLKQIKNKDTQQMFKLGVLQSPTKLDDVIASLQPGKSKAKKLFDDAWDLPASLNQSIEDRMRVGMYMAMRKAGYSPDKAAAGTLDNLLEYAVPTKANKLFRTVVPFGAFLSQTIPQQTKLLMSNLPEGRMSGAIAGGTARFAASDLLGSNPDDSLYPDMAGRTALPIGDDEKGNPQYITQTGLPIESLSDLPMSFGQRELERTVGMVNPLAKLGYSMVSGRDPYFGTAYGSYDQPWHTAKALGAEAGGAWGTARKVAGSGLVQPAVHMVGRVDPWFDERKTAGEVLMNEVLGLRVRSVDEDQAVRLQLEQAIKDRSGVQSYNVLADQSNDPETANLMDDYQAATKRLRDKRKREKELAAATVQ